MIYPVQPFLSGTQKVAPGIPERPSILADRPSGVTSTSRTEQIPRYIRPPFWVERFFDENGDPYYTVTSGDIGDHVNQTGDALLHYSPDVLETEGENIGKPKRFQITEGQSIYVYYMVLETGAIGIPDEKPTEWPSDAQSATTPCGIVVGEGLQSFQYQPATVGDDTTGAPGVYFVELANILDGELVPLAMGSNIEHYRQLPRFKTLGGLEIFQKYNMDEGNYKYYGPTGGRQITITKRELDYLIEWVGGANADITIKYVKLVTPDFPDEFDSIQTTIEIPERTATVSITLPDITGTTYSSGSHTHASTTTISDPDPASRYLIGTTDSNQSSPPDYHEHPIDILYSIDHDHSASTTIDFGGSHNHGVTIAGATYSSGVSLTTPAESVEVTLKVPKRPYITPTEEPPYVLAFRQGVFIGEYQEGQSPAVEEENGQPVGGALVTKTIYVFDPAFIPYPLDLSKPLTTLNTLFL